MKTRISSRKKSHPFIKSCKVLLLYDYVYSPRKKVMLVADPDPSDANEYAVFMQDEIEMDVIAVVSDEHAQVVCVVFLRSSHVDSPGPGCTAFNLPIS